MGRRIWTEAEAAQLVALYPVTPMPELQKRFERPACQIYSKARVLGLRRSEAYLASPHACRLRRGGSVGASTRFQKGGNPHNAGQKGWQAGGRAEATQFKKGHRPQTWVPIGSERIAGGYRQRKLTETGYPPRDWVPVHVLLWREHHGDIPPGHVVCFRDANRQNIVIENLELVSRADLARRNAMHHRYPDELKGAIRALGWIKRKIRERSKHEKQD